MFYIKKHELGNLSKDKYKIVVAWKMPTRGLNIPCSSNTDPAVWDLKIPQGYSQSMLNGLLSEKGAIFQNSKQDITVLMKVQCSLMHRA